MGSDSQTWFTLATETLELDKAYKNNLNILTT